MAVQRRIDGDPITVLDIAYLGAARDHGSSELVTGHDRQRRSEFALEDVQICSAKTACRETSTTTSPGPGFGSGIVSMPISPTDLMTAAFMSAPFI
jgi:hypothetical protein